VAASVPVLDVAEAQVEADGLGQQGQQCSLLQLVVQDGCVTLAPACSHISLPFFVERGGGGGKYAFWRQFNEKTINYTRLHRAFLC